MLTEAQVQAYKEDGYVLVKGVLSKDEAASLRDACHQLAQRLASGPESDPTWESAREMSGMAGEATMLQARHDVQFDDAAFARLLLDERLADAAADLIGSPNVQLHHTKMIIKPPENGSPFPMHQDHAFFPHTRHTVLAAICHFDDAPEEKGCVRVVPGSHQQGPIEHVTSGSPHLPFERYPLEASVPCPAEAGDVLFFNYLTVHGSGVNTSDEARTTLLVQMRDPEDDPAVDVHRSRGQGMMLRGIDPRPTQ
jgi:phytanoyl-CoA hydroxylase